MSVKVDYKRFNFLMAILTIIGILLLFIMLGLTYTEDFPKPYYYSDYQLIINLALVTYIVGLLVTLNIAYYINAARELFESERKKLSFGFFYLYYVFFMLTMLVLSLGLIWFMLNNVSNAYIPILGFKLYFYPLSLGISMIFGYAAVLYFYLFVENEYYSQVTNKHYMFVVMLYAFAIFLLSLPTNYYGIITPKNAFDTRIFSNLLLMLTYFYVIYRAVKESNRRIQKVQEKIILNKLRITKYGFLTLIGFFFFYVLDAVFGGGKPYTLFMIPAYVSMILGLLLIYLGTLTPGWLEKMLG